MGARSALPVYFLVLYLRLDLLYILNHLYPSPSISIFPRLDQPSISLLGFKRMLELSRLLFFLLLPYRLESFLILLLESNELLIVVRGDVEGHWDVFKRIYVLGLVVDLQVHEEGFLVVEMPVVGQVVMDFYVFTSILDYFLFISMQLSCQSAVLAYHF